MIKVSKIEWAGDRRLRFRFSDGSVGEFDFGPILDHPGSMVEPLREETYFRRVFLEDGAPTWPNGFDADPEWLRREIVRLGGLRHPAEANSP